MFSSKTQFSILFFAIVVLNQGAHAEGNVERCISRQHQPTGVGLSRTPAAIRGLKPRVSIPNEGYLKLNFVSSDCCSERFSPIGDWTFVAGPYDPVSQRLYLWGFDKNGWIEVNEVADTWVFGESGTIEQTLYAPADDIEDVTRIARSEILNMQFYGGYTAPHWLTGRQSYQVYQIRGLEETRVPELEAGKLYYVGDDLTAGFAVFAPVGASWRSGPEVLTWYDGSEIVAPPPGLPHPKGFCQ